jgi:chromosome partitioning protein
MFDGRNNLANEVVREVRTHFAGNVFETVVPRNVRLSECSSFGKPIILYDVDSKGCLAYLNLAKEVLGRNQPKTENISIRISDGALQERGL